MTRAFIIRQRIEGDSAALAEIFRRSIQEVASRDYRPAQIEAWSRFADENTAWDRRLRTRLVWVAEEQGQPIGFIQLELPDHIDLIYVHPAHMRKGVATALLATVEEAARRNGINLLNVEASITSRPFFEARGFETISPQIVTARGEDFLNYRMEKWLR
jgi:putative acetyltransferase